MNYYLQSAIYLASFLIPCGVSIFRYKQFDKGFKTIALLVFVSFFVEVFALFSAVVFKNNLMIYNFELLINTILTLSYFEIIMQKLKKIGVIRILQVLTFIFWVLSVTMLHKINSINTSFLIFSGVLNISLSILFLDTLSSDKRKEIFRLSDSPNFWITSILLFYWCFSFVQWALYRTFTKETYGFELLEMSLTLVTILVNLGYSIIFFRYPKFRNKC